jgi:ankyrin repeat protein
LDARGKSALHYACEAGNAELVRLLLSKGLDLHAGDGAGNTCVHFAGPHAGLLLWLVHEQGALPDVPNAEGQTPLFPAAASAACWL